MKTNEETYKVVFEFLRQKGLKLTLEDLIKEMFMYFANEALNKKEVNILDKKVSGEIVATLLFAIGENIYADNELIYVFNVSSLGNIFEYNGKVSTGKESLLVGSILVDLKSKMINYEGKVLFEDKIVYDPIIKVIKFSENLCKLIYQKVKDPLRKFISTLFLNSLIKRDVSLDLLYPNLLYYFLLIK